MPATETSSHYDERDRDRDPERGDRSDRGDKADRGSKQKSAAAATKSKDLSHVPCKFFKVGACTAGSSCPFSHAAQEPGHHKEVCAWFVKGNCKFGHKCALAHLMPGQPMSMDRKNKKLAQQQAASASGSTSGGFGTGSGSAGGKDGKNARSKKDSNANGTRNPLLAGGSTAPTRVLHPGSSSGRPPIMPLKSTISPSAPAPPLKDTDFPSFDPLDETASLPNAPAQGRAGDNASNRPFTTEILDARSDTARSTAKPSPLQSPTPLPVSVPRNHISPTHVDYGPIGSPPVASHISRARSPNSSQAVAFSPGTSPRPVRGHNSGASINGVGIAASPSRAHGLGIAGTPNTGAGVLSSSPFSAPGTQTAFMSYTESGMRAGMTGIGGIAASLGTGLVLARKGWGNGSQTPGNEISGQPPLSSSFQTGSNNMGGRTTTAGEYEFTFEYDDFQTNRGRGIPGRGGAGNNDGKGESAVDDADLEDFIPGSLTDLLTPEERNRRMSRSNSGQPPGLTLGGVGGAAAGVSTGVGAGAGGGATGHRYSRSVPAPSLLGDISSIWADTKNAPPMPGNAMPITSGRADGGFNGETGGGVGSVGAGSPSMAMLSPSNASAAFLPGFHSHYRAQLQQQQGPGGVGGTRHVSNPLYGGGRGVSGLSALAGGAAFSPPSSSGLAATYRPSPFDLMQNPLHNPTHPNHAAATAGVPNPMSTNVTAAAPAMTNAANTRPIPAPTNNPNANTTAMNNNPAHHVLLSPGARALQAHAPGQSLPQGLAAGYSRIHALPPVSSPGSAGLGDVFGATSPSGMNGTEWGAPGTSPTPNLHSGSALGAHSPSANSGGATTGLDSMFSRLSYSAAAGRTGATNPTVPPGLSRNLNGHGHPGRGGPLSPLSGPSVMRNDDDDDLFNMDG